jgi:hypothetical protein
MNSFPLPPRTDREEISISMLVSLVLGERLVAVKCYDRRYSGIPAFVAQRIEHLTTDQKVGGSSPSKRTTVLNEGIG